VDTSEELRALADELESLLLAARDDQRNKRWGSYDMLLSKYDGVRAAIEGLRNVVPWTNDLPVIVTVPKGARGVLISGGPAITGMGTAAEKAKYTEIVMTCEPLLKKVRRAADAASAASKPVLHPLASAVPPARDPRKVFVAYGSNEKARIAMFSFLRALDLSPLEWPYMCKLTGVASPSNRQVIDAGMKTAQCYVVLLTPDELVTHGRTPEAGGTTGAPRAQARPNVLAELGMTWNEDRSRTVVVTLEDARPPSDFDGIQRVQMDNSPQQRKRLVLSLRNAGCSVNEDGTDWMSPEAGGDFDNAVSALAESPIVSRPKVDAGIAARREELVAAAVQAFEGWAGGKTAYSTKLYREWIRCGGVPDYVTFDYEMCGRVASELANAGRGTVNPPLKEEYTDDFDEGQRQYEYLVSDGTWPPGSARRNRGRWDDSGDARRNF
jgi:predicted nucleotide-binding protein